MKKPFLVLCLVFFSNAIWGHTFLITTLETQNSDENNEVSNKNITIIENGMMDSLFDSGHIFFSSRRLFDETSEVEYKVAQESGADYILEIYFEQNSNLVHYFLYDATKEKMITMETFSNTEVETWKRGSIDDFYYEAGEYISHKVYILL